MVRLGIVGSRSFSDYLLFKHFILYELCYPIKNVSTIVSGGAKGADSLARVFAGEIGVSIREFYPEWDKYGKRAGYVRNRLIVENSDTVIAFWDGATKGTKHTIDICSELGVVCYVCRFSSGRSLVQ